VKLLVNVTFDEQRGYVGTAAALPQLVVALSLNVLRQRVAALLPDKVEVVLSLDQLARRERDLRRSGGQSRPTDYMRG
jgi:hypothetical protein